VTGAEGPGILLVRAGVAAMPCTAPHACRSSRITWMGASVRDVGVMLLVLLDYDACVSKS